MKRAIDTELIEWKDDPARKILLVRGARQVGKTYAIRTLAKTFLHFIEINFEEEKQIHSFFQDSLNPHHLIEKLSAYYQTPIIPGETLLFFDEIQACPNALSSLRFFYEKINTLHVAAAGSLLEFALAEIPSHGVGRITSRFIYPLSFFEFLNAVNETALITMIEQSGLLPIDPVFHKKLCDYLKVYFIIGGLPNVVQCYVNEHDLLRCQQKIDDIIETYRDDFAKYRKRLPANQLRETFDSIVFQVGSKFKYSRLDSQLSHQSLKESLDLLLQAGLIMKIFHTSARGIPFGGQMDMKKFKIILFDIGIHQRLSGTTMGDYLVAKDFNALNKGNIAEAFVGLELIHYHSAHSRPQLYYWHREIRGSNAEVDYLIQNNELIVPVEVKSGTKGHMQSLHLFMKERGLNKGIRFSLENFGNYDAIQVLPLYAVKLATTVKATSISYSQPNNNP